MPWKFSPWLRAWLPVCCKAVCMSVNSVGLFKTASFVMWKYISLLGRPHLVAWSARRRNLYLTTHNTRKRQTSLLLARFEPTIPVSERPQTHALDRAATRIIFKLYLIKPKNGVVTSLTCRFVCISVGQVSPRQQGGGTCHGKPKLDEISGWNKERPVTLIKYGWKAQP